MIGFFPLGDSALQLTFGHSISPETHQRIRSFMRLLEQHPVEGIRELVPSYTLLVVHYDPTRIKVEQLVDRLRELEQLPVAPEDIQPKTIEIPVLYGSTFGTDWQEVINYTGLSEQELIERHSAPDYKVYMLGFTPGFAYLGGMPPQLATPRKQTPAAVIAPGSVGIAGEQTGIYPIESPGGWQIIGRTPLKLFRPDAEKPFLLEAGQLVRFYPITPNEYERLNQYDA